jgi:hypothetical protein
MQDYNAIILLKKLTRKELRDFSKYLNYRCMSDHLVHRIFDFLVPAHPHYTFGQALTPAYIHEQCFPGVKNDNDKKVLNLLADLFRILKDFLLTQYVQQTSFQRAYLWQEILKERNIHSEYFSEVNATAREAQHRDAVLALTQRNLPNSFFEDSLEMYQRRALLDQRNHYDVERYLPKSDVTQINRYALNLKYAYTLERLKLACDQLSRFQQEGKKVEFPDLDALLETFTDQELESVPLLKIYLFFYQFYFEPTIDKYHEVFNLVERYYRVCSKSECHKLAAQLNNVSGQLSKQGHHAPMERLFSLVQLMSEQGIFEHSYAMSVTFMLNIINFACNKGLSEWADAWLIQHQSYIEEAYRSDVEKLAQCMILFKKQEYAEVIFQLNLKEQVFRHFHYGGRAKLLNVQSYYFEYPKMLKGQLKKMRVYVNRHFETDKKFGNELLFFIQIMELIISKVPVTEIRKALDNNQGNTMTKAWLEEQLSTLEARSKQ